MSQQDIQTWWLDLQRTVRHDDTLEKSEIMARHSYSFLDEIKDLPFQRVLDVGCGYGIQCRWFTQHGRQATGITVSVSEAQKKFARDSGYDLAIMDFEHTAFPDQTFDAVWSHHTLEHTFSPIQALLEWRRVLKDGGYLFVAMPAYESDIQQGHYNIGFNVGRLVYLMTLCGFETKTAKFREKNFELRAIVRRAPTVPKTCDLAELRHLFPDEVNQHWVTNQHDGFALHAFQGKIDQINWPFPPEPVPLKHRIKRAVRTVGKRLLGD